MRTALDTNVLSAVWGRETSAARIAAFLDGAYAQGGLVISPFVYLEARANPFVKNDQVDHFLKTMGVEVDWLIEREIWELAAERFAQYANRRHRQGGGETKRLTSDFVIAAHALLRADRLITLDQRRYRTDFAELILIEP